MLKDLLHNPCLSKNDKKYVIPAINYLVERGQINEKYLDFRNTIFPFRVKNLIIRTAKNLRYQDNLPSDYSMAHRTFNKICSS